MRTFVDKNRRILLAFFGVLLMIVFMLPSNLQPSGGQSNPVIGHIGPDKTAVRASESAAAEADWEIVTRRVLVADPTATDPREAWLPVANLLLRDPYSREFRRSVPVAQIDGHRQSYLLLLKEAEQNGVVVPQESVDEILNSPGVGIVDSKQNRIIPFADLGDMDVADRIRAAVGRLLMVSSSYQGGLQAIKISQPVSRQFLAEQIQTVNLSLVSIPASQFPATAPTAQQLEEQFKKYAAVNPESMHESPHGYGYRFPDRVKLQSIEIPTSQVRAAAERVRTKDANAQYQWDRDAFRYYSANQSEFPTTAPATTAPTTVAAATRPTTRPFAEVRDEARRAVLDNDSNKLTRQILEKITSTIAGDYVAYRNALNTGGANAKVPASSIGPAYNTYEYFQTLATQIQKTFDLLPPTRAFDSFLTVRDVAILPGLGQARVEGIPLPGYVFTRSAAFSSEKDDAKTLQPYEPAPVAGDEVGNVYVFRLTDAQAAHAPASLQEVAAAVETDVRGAVSYEEAKKVAADLLNKAKPSGSLETAASAANYNVTKLNAVRLNFSDPTPLAPLNLTSPIAQRNFIRQVSELTASISKANPKPIALIELPRDGRAIVAQVTDVQSIISTPAELALFETQAAAEATRMLAGSLIENWFRQDAIIARTKFVPTADHDDAKPATPSAPADGPPRQPIM